MAVIVGPQARYNKSTFPTASELQDLIDGGEKEIRFMEGTYSLSSGLSIPAGVTLRGAGPTATILDYGGGAPLTELLVLAAGACVEGLQLKRSGAGAVTYGATLAAPGARAIDLNVQFMGLRVSSDSCRIEKCVVSQAADGLVVTGDFNQIFRNLAQTCVRGIHVNGGESNIIESNQIVGGALSERGIHMDSTADFNQVCMNLIKDIQAITPGRGIDLEALGSANIFRGNIFSGIFGTKAIVADGSVPGTVQFIGNLTHAVTPPSARLSLADLGGATGVANT